MTVGNWKQISVGDLEPAPLSPPPEEDIIAKWGGKTEPLVSIVCATYQHAPYIAAALDCFLSQETTFPFEILVRDDASTDGTAETVRDYAKRYPTLIRPFFESENTWPDTRTAFFLQPKTSGKYIIFSEGDDYWPGANHLAPLAQALEDQPGASAAFSPGLTIKDGLVVHTSKDLVDLEDRLEIPHFPGKSISAILARNVPVPEPAMQALIDTLDRFHLSFWASRGPLVGVPSADPSTYRLHEGGSWSPRSARDRAARVVTSYLWIAKWWRDEGDPELALEFEKAALARLEAVVPVAAAARRPPDPTAMQLLWRAVSKCAKSIAPGAHEWLWRTVKRTGRRTSG